MGRYGDEIKRITRAQARGPRHPGPAGSAGDSAHDGDGKGDDDRRGDDDADGRTASGRGPIVALLVVVAIAGLGWLLVRQLMADSKLQDCVMSGRKNCAPVEIDSSGR